MKLFSKKRKEVATEVPEENAKRRTLTKGWDVAVSIVAMCSTLFHIVGLTVWPLDPFVFRGVSLLSMAMLCFFLVPATKKGPWNRPSVYDLILIAMCISVMVYLALNYVDIYYRAGFQPTTADEVFAFFTLFLVIAMTRRLIGWSLPIIAFVFLAYAVFGASLPGILGHRGYTFQRVLSILFSTEGFFGTAMSAASNYIVLFVTFAAFLTCTGVGEFFTRIATAVAGRYRGGPAKVAIFSSALMGTVSGSAMGNVVATGSFTIPLMKKTGYPATFAGAVEAAASTGGQIMPPVMGAVAFVLAEFAAVSYKDVMTAAVIPAIIYFASIFFMVDFQAKKLKLVGVSKDELPRAGAEMRNGGYLLIPLIVFIVVITVLGRSIIMGALIAIVLAIAISWIAPLFIKTPEAKAGRVGGKSAAKALKDGALGSMDAVAACGTAGIVVGVMSLTGLGQRLGSAVMQLTNGNLPLTLVAVMVFCLILGMGMPTVPAYILAAAVGTPTLIAMEVPTFVAHMFCMYFATISTITPPVALAAYAGAGIAKASPAATGWQAMRLGLAAYIVPYVFVYSPQLLGQGAPMEVILAAFSATLGAYALAGAIGSDYNPVLRVLYGVAAICLIVPGWQSDLVGLIIVVAGYIVERRLEQGKKAAEPVQEKKS